MKKIISTLFASLLFLISSAQSMPMQQEAQTGLRANDKIWVVMAICLTILIGLLIYLYTIDRRISKLEKK